MGTWSSPGLCSSGSEGRVPASPRGLAPFILLTMASELAPSCRPNGCSAAQLTQAPCGGLDGRQQAEGAGTAGRTHKKWLQSSEAQSGGDSADGASRCDSSEPALPGPLP